MQSPAKIFHAEKTGANHKGEKEKEIYQYHILQCTSLRTAQNHSLALSIGSLYQWWSFITFTNFCPVRLHLMGWAGLGWSWWSFITSRYSNQPPKSAGTVVQPNHSVQPNRLFLHALARLHYSKKLLQAFTRFFTSGFWRSNNSATQAIQWSSPSCNCKTTFTNQSWSEEIRRRSSSLLSLKQLLLQTTKETVSVE